jgi:hypothetical protein
MTPVTTPPTAATPATESVEQKFRRLADIWHKAVAHHSSTSIRNNHPAYQEIIALGPAVVPYLLGDLQQNGNHWFWALKVITGAAPVAPEDRGDVAKVTEAWLRWGRANGYRR